MKLLYQVILIFVLVSCKEKKGYIEKAENNGDAVITIGSDDEAMNKAILKAKESYADFLEAFGRADEANRDYTIKMKFRYGNEGDGEHMWLGDLHKKNNELFGVLHSEPMHVTWRSWGDTIGIKKDSITDWMYIRNDTMVGGYTIRVLYDKMSEAEKRAFREQVDFKLDQ